MQERNLTEEKANGVKAAKWYKCPYCKKSLFPIKPDTVIKNLTYRCKACKHDIEVNIE